MIHQETNKHCQLISYYIAWCGWHSFADSGRCLLYSNFTNGNGAHFLCSRSVASAHHYQIMWGWGPFLVSSVRYRISWYQAIYCGLSFSWTPQLIGQKNWGIKGFVFASFSIRWVPYWCHLVQWFSLLSDSGWWVLYGNRPQAPPSSRAALEVIFNPAALAVILLIFAA